MRRAIEDHNMIDENDRIAVGLSGGKDSLTLAYALKLFQRFSDKKFEILAVHIDMGFKEANAGEKKALFKSLEEKEIGYKIIETNLAEIIFDIRKEENPCSLCSKMRRGALNTAAKELGFNKIALGHHADDLAETFFLSLFFEGRMSTFAPTAYMDRSDISLIRPFIYIEEKNIISAAKRFPILNNPCPANKNTKREYIKNLLKTIGADIPFAQKRILSAITHPERNNLWDTPKKL
jgi:tRNA(Ile)-lysidine synthase TilS/MesJ